MYVQFERGHKLYMHYLTSIVAGLPVKILSEEHLSTEI